MTGKIAPATPYALDPDQPTRTPDGGRNYKRRRGLARVDGRTKEAALLRDTRQSLLEYLGRPPDAMEAALIDRIAWLELKCGIIERKIAQGTDSDYDGRAYQGWSNTLSRAYSNLAKAAPKGEAKKAGRQSISDKLRAAAAAGAE